MRRVVGERLAGLGGDTQRVVTVAAVAGDVADQEVLATVAGLAPDRFADAVAEAVAAGILWCRSSERPACGFVHALLREAARAGVDAAVRRGLHLELAAALEALPPRHGRLAEVAYHRRAALPAGNPQLMVDQTMAAAEQALRVFAHEPAVAECTAGLTATGRYGSQDAARRWRARLLGVLGEAQQHAGDPVRARQTLTDAQALAGGAGDPVLALRGHSPDHQCLADAAAQPALHGSVASGRRVACRSRTQPRNQIAKASSSNATATRRLAGSSTASS